MLQLGRNAVFDEITEFRDECVATLPRLGITAPHGEDFFELVDKENRAAFARIAERRARLEAKKREMTAKAEELAIADGKAGKCTGRWAAYQLGKILTPESIVLNDGISRRPSPTVRMTLAIFPARRRLGPPSWPPSPCFWQG